MKTLLMIAALYGAMYATAASATEFYYLSRAEVDYYDAYQQRTCETLAMYPQAATEPLISRAKRMVAAVAAGAQVPKARFTTAMAVVGCDGGVRLARAMELGARDHEQSKN